MHFTIAFESVTLVTLRCLKTASFNQTWSLAVLLFSSPVSMQLCFFSTIVKTSISFLFFWTQHHQLQPSFLQQYTALTGFFFTTWKLNLFLIAQLSRAWWTSTQKAYSVPSIDTESCVLNNMKRQQQGQQQDKGNSEARATVRWKCLENSVSRCSEKAVRIGYNILY